MGDDMGCCGMGADQCAIGKLLQRWCSPNGWRQPEAHVRQGGWTTNRCATLMRGDVAAPKILSVTERELHRTPP